MMQEQTAEGSSALIARSRSLKFTPERIRQIENLVERGKSRQEIADILGVTVGSLQVTCSKMGISLRRPRLLMGYTYLKSQRPFMKMRTELSRLMIRMDDCRRNRKKSSRSETHNRSRRRSP
jgi:DNA-binding NarL/FixJ family response regulator